MERRTAKNIKREKSIKRGMKEEDCQFSGSRTLH